VSVGRETGAVMVRVSDTGVGVAQENLRRLWEPFFSTKGSGGTGLGLAISHRIVEKHGGRITVASEPGKGSAFTVYLPAPCATPLAAPVDAESAKQTSDASDDRGINEG